MTRWARSGNTQKHKKMPGDATRWGEFDHQKTEKKVKTHKKKKNQSNTEQSNKPDFIVDTSRNANESGAHSSQEQDNQNHSTAKKSLETMKSKKNIKATSMGDKNYDGSSPVKKDKKEKYLKKLQKKRVEKGIVLLPSRVERKLYNIRKKLSEKGVPVPVLKEILRKERRKAELNFRKTFNPSKLCFHCRQPGHMLADCPEKFGSTSQETGMCFKCGSAEHISYKCPEKIQGFPLAKCFICKEQGHISKDCPRNKHGVYPKGGKCNLCGNINHLKKDCPSLSKKRATDDSTITLHTIEDGTSIDAEVIQKRSVKKENVKKAKIVKF